MYHKKERYRARGQYVFLHSQLYLLKKNIVTYPYYGHLIYIDLEKIIQL
jgi:hypothetical protein